MYTIGINTERDQWNWNSIQQYIHTYKVNWFLTKVQKQLSG